ncbi:hypothetical protein FQN54_008308 [Arachnomyces sp. PD_36]|nr:hypothetical protein FQN54_008308 [Arachnomyces sp. PD_36]
MTDTIYYELSWAILSSICIITGLIGCLVVSVAGVKCITSVPIVVSVAGAVANGLCFYANYTDAPDIEKVVASVFADVFWMVILPLNSINSLLHMANSSVQIQEAGLSFYSYFILTNILKFNARRIFLTLFWMLVACVVGTRTGIATFRALSILRDGSLNQLVMKLHHAYFLLILSLEVLSAFFLLRSFSSARRASLQAPDRPFTLRLLVQQLILSTELRLATLCLIGTSRAVLYTFRTTQQTATNVATQIDRFVYTVECLFPVVMMFDILIAKLVYAKISYTSLNNNSGELYSHSNSNVVRDSGWPLQQLRSSDSPRPFPIPSSTISALR